MNTTDTTVLSVTCPSCFAAEGEPCSKYCDDMAPVQHIERRTAWDDEEW